jgi:hypothetical protein
MYAQVRLTPTKFDLCVICLQQLWLSFWGSRGMCRLNASDQDQQFADTLGQILEIARITSE